MESRVVRHSFIRTDEEVMRQNEALKMGGRTSLS